MKHCLSLSHFAEGWTCLVSQIQYPLETKRGHNLLRVQPLFHGFPEVHNGRCANVGSSPAAAAATTTASASPAPRRCAKWRGHGMDRSRRGVQCVGHSRALSSTPTCSCVLKPLILRQVSDSLTTGITGPARRIRHVVVAETKNALLLAGGITVVVYHPHLALCHI